MKTIHEQTGYITQREVEIGPDKFLVCVEKFGQVWSYFVLNESGQTVNINPFQAVIDDIMRK